MEGQYEGYRNRETWWLAMYITQNPQIIDEVKMLQKTKWKNAGDCVKWLDKRFNSWSLRVFTRKDSFMYTILEWLHEDIDWEELGVEFYNYVEGG